MRFADRASYTAWEASSQRAEWLERGRGFVEHSEAVGTSDWFTDLEKTRAPAPPRWKQMIAIFLVFFPLSMGANYLLAPIAGPLPIWLRVFLAVLIVTPVMTYWGLPFVNKRLRPWFSRTPA
jgi:antibiotic biosynthesis monooxygenase (ABM) superfamily enzyme